MGVTELARLSTLLNPSLPLIYSHLNSSCSTSPSTKWKLTIQSYRSLPFSTSNSQSEIHSTSKSRILWTINDSSYPGITFIFIEDSSKPDRETFTKQNRKRQKQRQDETFSESAGIFSHPRFQSHVLSNSFLPLLLKTNLPPPLGVPSSGDGGKSNQPTSGPGSWIQRGSPLYVEGLEMFVGELDQNVDDHLISKSGIEGGGKEIKVRIGSVTSGRSYGALFELEYLPLTHLPPSPFLPSLLYSLLPPTLLNSNLSSNQQSQQASQQQTIPILLSSSIIQKESLGEAIPSMLESLELEEEELESGTETERDEGWRGLEKGRRSALLLLMMLKGEGVL